MTREAHSRRLMDNLVIVGGGVIAFGAWTLVKMVLLFVLQSEQAIREMFQMELEFSWPVVVLGLAIVTVVDLALRLYIGLSAWAEGHGRHKGPVYLVVVALTILGTAMSVYIDVLTYLASPLDMVVALTIDVTSLATLVLLLASAICLRRLSATE